MKNICVMASGGGSNFQAVLDAIDRGEINGKVALLIYDRKDAFAAERAKQAGIPAIYMNKKDYTDAHAHDEAVLRVLTRAETDIVVLAGYLSILGPKTVWAFRHRIINTHPALIPAFCGMGFYGGRVHRAVLEYGAKVSGCTIHFVDEGADTGPIIFQACVPVEEDDDVVSLAERVLKEEHRLLPRAVALLCDGRIHCKGRRVTIRPEETKVCVEVGE